MTGRLDSLTDQSTKSPLEENSVPVDQEGPRRRLGILQSVGPVVAAVVISMVLLFLLGRNPFTFYLDIIRSGLLSGFGIQESINRTGPLLVIAAGLVISFRANVWHLGIDGCFLLTAVVVGGTSPLLVGILPTPLILLLMVFVSLAVGAVWSWAPAYLKIHHGVNEIVTTLIMTYLGTYFAHFLVKSILQDPTSRAAAQTRVLPIDHRLPTLFGTRIHIGILIGLAVILATHYVITRTPLGLRLQMMGANRRSAEHFGFAVRKLTFLAFLVAGALYGLGGGLSIIGDWGVVAEGWNPAWGFLVVPLVFLARKNALASIVFVAGFSVISIGSDVATRNAELPSNFQLVIVGMILLFLTVSEYLQIRKEQETAHMKTYRRSDPQTLERNS